MKMEKIDTCMKYGRFFVMILVVNGFQGTVGLAANTNQNGVGSPGYLSIVAERARDLLIFKEKVDRAKKKGFNQIDITFPWLRLEPIQNEFWLRWVDEHMDYVVKEGFNVILTISYAHPPEWIDEKYFIKEEGGRRPLGEKSSKMLVISDPQARAWMKRVLAKLVQRYKNRYSSNPILFYSIRFSPPIISEYWLDPFLAQSTQAQNDFQEWLKSEYATIRYLNKRWGTAYTAFSQVTTTKLVRQKGNSWRDWVNYRTFVLKRLFDQLTKAVHDSDKNAKIGVHLGLRENFQSGSRGAYDIAKLIKDLDWIIADGRPLETHKLSGGLHILRNKISLYAKDNKEGKDNEYGKLETKVANLGKLEPPAAKRRRHHIAEDSPFGMLPARVVPPGYVSDRVVGHKKFKKIAPYKDALNIGVKWHRGEKYLNWSRVQPNLQLEKLNFRFYDRRYGEVPPEINIIGSIVPGHDNTLKGSYMPVDKAKFKTFVKKAVERYDGDGIEDMPNLKNPIRYWQIGNEPDNRKKKDFSELQRISYKAVKEACPECKVLIGGVPGMPPVSAYIRNFNRGYLPILENLSGSKSFDIFDLHWYGDKTDYRGIEEVYEYIKAQVDLLGLSPEEGYWITEMGAYSGNPKGFGRGRDIFERQTEAEQASDYLKRFVFSLSLGIKKVFLAFGLIEGFKHDDSYFDHTGFIYNGKGSDDLGMGVRKLAYYTYKKMVEILEGSNWDNIETLQTPDGIHVYKFIKPFNNADPRQGKPIWVAWNDNEQSKVVVINGVYSASAKITEAVPKYGSGQRVTAYTTAFNTYTQVAKENKVLLSLEKVPVFVELE